jgi:hypothetical protein
MDEMRTAGTVAGTTGRVTGGTGTMVVVRGGRRNGDATEIEMLNELTEEMVQTDPFAEVPIGIRIVGGIAATAGIEMAGVAMIALDATLPRAAASTVLMRLASAAATIAGSVLGTKGVGPVVTTIVSMTANSQMLKIARSMD